MRRTLIILAVMLSISVLVGCNLDNISGDTPSGKASADAALIGKYVLVSWEDEDGDYLETLVSAGIDPEGIYIGLRGDGTYTWDLSALDMGIDKGTYRVTNTTLILSYDGGRDTLTINGNRLCYSEDSDVLIFEKTGKASSLNASAYEGPVGKYILTYFEYENGDYVDRLISIGIRPYNIYLELRSDGSYTWDQAALRGGSIDHGTYAIDNTTLVLSGGRRTGKLTIDGNCLSYYTDEGNLVIYQKTGIVLLRELDDNARTERYYLTYASDLDGMELRSLDYEELDINVGDLYLELRDDGTTVLDLHMITGQASDIYTGTYYWDEEGIYYTSPTGREEGTLIFNWDGVRGGRSFATLYRETALSGGGYTLSFRFDMNGRTLAGSLAKELPTPALSFTKLFPDSMLGVYAMTSWADTDGADTLKGLALGGIRGDLHYIDFLSDGKFTMSLHASRPGDVQTGSYRVQGEIVTLAWDDSDREDTGAINGTAFALNLSTGEKMVFDKGGPTSYASSAASYRDGYFGALQGSAKVLEGTVLLVSIFVNTDTSSWSDAEMKNARGALREAMSFMEGAAAGYDKNLHFYHWQTDAASEDLFYQMDFTGEVAAFNSDTDTIRSMYEAVNDFIENNIPYLALADKYQTDNITYNVFFSSPGRSYARPFYADDTADSQKISYHEKTFLFTDNWRTIAHEILHTFGAVDLYYELDKEADDYGWEGGKFKRYADYDGDIELLNYVTENYTSEIMRSTYDYKTIIPTISPLNAYRLGWLDDIPELKQFPHFRLPGSVPGIWAHYSYRPKK
ncbi:MAG: hypothetical protein FWF10_07620 [Clostridiales bacterium]|nr:hypothetical protein [Clostridiales bacterium]